MLTGRILWKGPAAQRERSANEPIELGEEKVRYALLMFLVGSLLVNQAPTQARPCRGTVLVEADTTVAHLGPETQTLVAWRFDVSGPEYPEDLRSLREGKVTARFVVDTNGRVVNGTASILSESNRGFGQSVCRFLQRAHLRPVPVDGRKRSVAVSAANFSFSFGQ